MKNAKYLALMVVCGVILAFVVTAIAPQQPAMAQPSGVPMPHIKPKEITCLGDVTIQGHDLDLYDSAGVGWTGIKFNTPEIEFWIGGTLMGTIDTTGAYTDEVS